VSLLWQTDLEKATPSITYLQHIGGTVRGTASRRETCQRERCAHLMLLSMARYSWPNFRNVTPCMLPLNTTRESHHQIFGKTKNSGAEPLPARSAGPNPAAAQTQHRQAPPLAKPNQSNRTDMNKSQLAGAGSAQAAASQQPMPDLHRRNQPVVHCK
jgi:hypothetical protein